MYNAQQVRSKQRMAIRRREEDVEQLEIESGEINLIPYLDIVTNLVLFMLASISSGIILGQINTTLPDRAPPATNTPPPSTDELPLKMVVSVTREQIIVWSVSGLEGTLQAPLATFPRIGRVGAVCDGNTACETSKCDANKKCVASNEPEQWIYDYQALNKTLFQIANKHYTDKPRKKDTYQSVLMPDPSAPYGTLISCMSAMRCYLPDPSKPAAGCYLPTDDPKLKKAVNPIDDIGKLYDTDRAKYNPTTMALFHDVVFSPGVTQ